MDTNIDNYTIQDLLLILNLPQVDQTQINPLQINQASSHLINKMNRERKYDLATFFEQARKKLLAATIEDEEDDAEEEEEEEQQQSLPPLFPKQTHSQNEMNKYTNREQQIQLSNDPPATHFAMQQERLGIIESHNVPLVQGTLNPNLTITVTRTVSIDSQYRQNILPFANGDTSLPSYNTDYTLDLTDTLSKVTSLKLNSIHLPTTWYAFDATTLGNTCFECSGQLITISAGNYKALELVQALNTQFAAKSLPVNIAYNSNTGKATFTNTDPSQNKVITFYKNGGVNLCAQANGSNNCSAAGQKINQHLGWNLGFRIEPDTEGNITLTLPANSETVTADAPIDVYGPKYFLLVLDDFNSNHLNQGLVNIANTATKLDVPHYYNNYRKNQEAPNTVCVDVNLNNTEIRKMAMLTKSFPRTLTQAQLYSTNEILANRKVALNNRTIGPTNSDIFALIPISGITNLRPDPYTVFGTPLQDSRRTYFGPVNIDRLRVRLLDDKGNLVNLNDNDWSFSLTVEQLYQY
jgi:hypothetical protein